MKFIHVRPPGIDHKYGAGGITIVYEACDSNKILVAASYCSGKDQYNKTTGRKIAVSRLKNQPLIVHMDGKIEHRHVSLVLNALLQSLPRNWEDSVDDLSDRRFFQRFSTQVLGPGGKLLTIKMDSRAGRVYSLDGKSSYTYPRGWVNRTPAWALKMLRELSV